MLNTYILLDFFRIPFIRNGLINSGRLPREASMKLLSLSGVKILDVGCGGGILSEVLFFYIIACFI
jgi:2-polyprenyl-3-methyl-5-hydroxy-6-metoxy-1,4-benzoquinol methylase